ncbi:MAG: mechanosensitive ion channel domain-containing protein [Alkalilacustris sp.]
MFRLLAVLAACLVTVPANAQSPAEPPPDSMARDDAARLLAEILQDEAARNALIGRLLAEAESGAGAAGERADSDPAPGDAPVPLVRELAEYTRDLGEQAAAFAGTLTRSAGDVLGVVTGAQAVNWAELEAALWSVLLVAGVALGLFFALRIPSDRFFGYLSRRGNGGSWLLSGARLLAFGLTDALVILLAWAGGYAVALATGEPGTMDIRQTLFLNAFLLIEMTKVALRLVLVPRHGRLRFAPMGDETAAYWYFWSSRLVSLLGYGILLVVPIVNTTVSFAVGRSVTMLIVVTALLTAILIVLQNRAPVRAALCARNRRNPDDILGRLLAGIGVVWHLVAILWLLALFVIWQASPADALGFMLVATLQSALAVVAGVVAMVVITRAISAGLRLPADVRRSLPLLEARLNAFVPGMLQVVRLIVALLVVGAIAQAWQVLDFLGWLASETGSDLVSRLLSALLVVAVALALWLAVSSFIDYRLNPDNGRPASPRERTLLALARNAFVVVLVVIASMLTLAQLGMNIAPLLAGAGVIGLAVAFGGQKLVADVINGVFIQIENAMNEGDVVTVGATTGVVERLTIRSVGLRDLSGTYHVIPFGSVDQVSNFMRGFGYHVANIGVAYREDTTRVKALMQDAFDRLVATEHGADVVGPFEMHGVVELADSAVVVRGRIKTRPGMQWGVGRAYTEIVKQVFDEAGVEIPFPHLTLYLGAGEVERLAALAPPPGPDAPPAIAPPSNPPPPSGDRP